MTTFCQTIDGKQRNLWVSCALALALMLVPKGAAAETITAFAASSLRDAVTEIAASYELETGDDVVLVFAASSAIARQVAQGAPADVVLLADQDWADWLVDQGALQAATAFAGNQLVVIGPSDAPELTDITALDVAIGDGVLAMAQTDAVPAGRYGKAALTSLGVWDALAPRVVQAPNVRAALRFVERGEAPLGIGYASDLIALPSLTLVYEFAADSHPNIIYSGGAVTAQGTDFMDVLQSPIGQSILMDWGFAASGLTQ